METLALDGIHVFYGEGHVLHGISLGVEEKDFVGIIGRNGVGKTTLLKAIIGLQKPRRGSILFKGINITHFSPHNICRLGISYVPQGREIFSELTVSENLKLGTFSNRKHIRFENSYDLVFTLFPLLRNRLGQKGKTLSGGEQQMLAIARGLLADPDLLLLDEPTEGLAPFLVKEIEDRLRIMNEELNLSIILVEQNLELVFRLVVKAYLIEKGMIIKEGTVADLRDDDVIKKHLVV